MDTIEIKEEPLKEEEELLKEEKELEEELARLEEERITTINNFDRYITIMEDYLTQRLISVLELNKENEGTEDLDQLINECHKFGDIFAVKRYNEKEKKYEYMSGFNANYSLLYLLAGERHNKIMGYDCSYYSSRNIIRVFRRTYFN